FATGRLTLTGCTVSDNTAGGNGGGLFNNANGTATLSHCIVSGNSAALDGGGLNNNGLTATLIDCALTDNTAGAKGGGAYTGANVTTTLSGGAVSDNHAPRGADLFWVPTFGGLSSPSIVYGTTTAVFTGHIGFGTAYPAVASV